MEQVSGLGCEDEAAGEDLGLDWNEEGSRNKFTCLFFFLLFWLVAGLDEDDDEQLQFYILN